MLLRHWSRWSCVGYCGSSYVNMPLHIVLNKFQKCLIAHRICNPMSTDSPPTAVEPSVVLYTIATNWPPANPHSKDQFHWKKTILLQFDRLYVEDERSWWWHGNCQLNGYIKSPLIIILMFFKKNIPSKASWSGLLNIAEQSSVFLFWNPLKANCSEYMLPA